MRFSAILLLLLSATSLPAVTIVSNIAESHNDAADYSEATFSAWTGSSFTTGPVTSPITSYQLNSAVLHIATTGSNTPSFFLRLLADGGGKPNSAALVSNFTVPDLSASLGSAYDYTFAAVNPVNGASPVLLDANTTYWLVAGATATDPNITRWTYTTSTSETGDPGWTIGDGYADSANQGASWTPTPTGGPYLFSVDATAVPEPTAAALAVLPLLAFSLRRSRKMTNA